MSQSKKPQRRKVTVVTPYGPAWEREANALARAYRPIVACEYCGRPRMAGYRCGTCDEGYVPDDDQQIGSPFAIDPDNEP